MLSAACSQRLLSLLNHAVNSCKEEEKQLEEELQQCHTLLRHWKISEKSLKENETPSTCHESEPSVEELHEVELLNKALEKALKVRGSRKADASSGKQPFNIQTVPVCPSTKDLSSKSTCKASTLNTKYVTSLLHPPYKTNLERKRIRATGKVLPSSGHITIKKETSNIEVHTEAKDVPTRTDQGSSNSHTSSFLAVETTGDNEQHCFFLKDRGATLKLPVKYRLEYTRNSRLWEKFYETQQNCSVSQRQFIQNYKQLIKNSSAKDNITKFSEGISGKSLSELEEEAVHLERVISSLHQRINSAKQSQWRGPQHWQNYHSLLILEALQQETSQQSVALQQLQQAAEQHLKWNEQLTGTTCTELRGCPASSCSADPLLLYSNPCELSQLTRCRLRILELKQKIYLQKVLREELIAEADSQCHKEPISWMLYRAIYTQLCEGGDRFPVLVHED